MLPQLRRAAHLPLFLARLLHLLEAPALRCRRVGRVLHGGASSQFGTVSFHELELGATLAHGRNGGHKLGLATFSLFLFRGRAASLCGAHFVRGPQRVCWRLGQSVVLIAAHCLPQLVTTVALVQLGECQVSRLHPIGALAPSCANALLLAPACCRAQTERSTPDGKPDGAGVVY